MAQINSYVNTEDEAIMLSAWALCLRGIGERKVITEGLCYLCLGAGC